MKARIKKQGNMFIDPLLNNMIVSKINKSCPSDIIDICNEESYESMKTFWNPDGIEGVPADIVTANTIPIKDSLVRYFWPDDPGKYSIDRVIIFDDYIKTKDDLCGDGDTDEKYIIGILNPYYSTETDTTILDSSMDNMRNMITSIFGLLFIKEGINNIFSSKLCGSLKKSLVTSDKFKYIKWNNESICMALKVWYGIQVSMLNSTIKSELYDSKKTEVSFIKEECIKELLCNSNVLAKRKLKFIVENTQKTTIDKAVERATKRAPKGEFHRHCLVWYVRGHWRTLKSGKKVFVKPQWRGPLRETKRNLDLGREREIIMKDDENGHKENSSI